MSSGIARRKLGDVVERVTVGHVGPTSEFYVTSGGVPFLRTQNVGDHRVIRDEIKFVTPEFHRRLGKSTLRRGDLIVSRVISDRVRCAVVPDDLDGANCANIVVIRPGPDVDARFVGYYMASPEGQASLLGRQVGSAQTVINTGVVHDWRLPLPPHREQRRIADILDKADAIRRKRKETIALTDELLRSAFLDMFGDPVTNPKGWPVKPLGKLARITTGNTPSRAIPEYFGKEIEWIKSDNINTPSHYLTRATEGLSAQGRAVGRTAPAGSTLMTCIAGSPECIGNVALADREVAFNQQINAVTPHDGVDYRFLYVLLLVGKRLVQAASTNSMKGMVSKGRLEDVVVPSPPPKAQVQFGEAFDRVLRLSRRQEVAQRESQMLFDTTVQRAFSGELVS